jgi:hypothetical protein
MCRAPLTEVRRLNLWSRQLQDVSILSDAPNLEILCLSSNKIQYLDIFPVCPNLLSLILRNNQVADFGQVEYLARLPKLHALWLADNPIDADPDYRARVVEMLPGLIRLDDADVIDVDRIPPPRPVPRTFPATVTPPAPARFGANSDSEPEPQPQSKKLLDPPTRRLIDRTGKRPAQKKPPSPRTSDALDDPETVTVKPKRPPTARAPKKSEIPRSTGIKGQRPPSVRIQKAAPRASDDEAPKMGPAESKPPPKVRTPRENDEPILAAILTLLPELKDSSLLAVIDHCSELVEL